MAEKPNIELPPRNDDGRMPKPDQKVVDQLVAYEEAERGYTICGAWKPVKGGVCCKRPMIGRTRCADDGGKSKRGRSHPAYKGAGYAMGLPTDLRAKYEAAEHVEQIKEVEGDLRIIWIRMTQLFEGLEDTGTTGIWKQLKVLARQYRETSKTTKNGKRKRRDLMERAFDLIESGADQTEIWREVTDLMERRRKLIETDHKVRRDEGLVYSAEQIRLAIDVLKEIVHRNAPGDLSDRIADDIDRTILGPITGRA